MLLARVTRRGVVRRLGVSGLGVLNASLLAACAQSSVSTSGGGASSTASRAASSASATTNSSAATAASRTVQAGTQTASGSRTTSAPAAATTATLAVKTLDFMRPSGGPAEDKAYIAMVSGWAHAHPGTKASFVSVPHANYETKLLTEIAGGVVRDVVGLLPGAMTVFAAKKAVIPLDAYVARSPQLQKDDFFPAHWADGQFQGKQWGIPPDGSPLVVAYNVGLFQADSVAEPTAAWTWNDCLATAQKLTKRSGNRTTQFGCSFSGAGNLLCWLFANNANVLDVATNTTTIDSANAVLILNAGQPRRTGSRHPFCVPNVPLSAIWSAVSRWVGPAQRSSSEWAAVPAGSTSHPAPRSWRCSGSFCKLPNSLTSYRARGSLRTFPEGPGERADGVVRIPPCAAHEPGWEACESWNERKCRWRVITTALGLAFVAQRPARPLLGGHCCGLRDAASRASQPWGCWPPAARPRRRPPPPPR